MRMTEFIDSVAVRAPARGRAADPAPTLVRWADQLTHDEGQRWLWYAGEDRRLTPATLSGDPRTRSTWRTSSPSCITFC